MKNKNLIAISGKKQNGKDTVGLIWQILLANKIFLPHGYSAIRSRIIEEFNNNTNEHLGKLMPVDIKKFAAKPKKYVADILGCKEEDFENNDFKEKILGTEWDKYVLTFTDNEGDFNKVVYSDKDLAKADYDELSAGGVYHLHLETIIMTPRKFLQWFCTDGGRDQVHPNIWVNALFSEYIPDESRWIITDVRYPNELQKIDSFNGVKIRVQRYFRKGYTPEGLDVPSNLIVEDVWEPSSETSLDTYKEWDYVIYNTGGLDDLIDKVYNIMLELNIFNDK